MAGSILWTHYCHFYCKFVSTGAKDRTEHTRQLVTTVEFVSTITCGIYFIFNSVLKRNIHIQFMDKIENVDGMLRKSFKIVADQSWIFGSYVILYITVFSYYLFSYWQMTCRGVRFPEERIFYIFYTALGIISTVSILAFVYFVGSIFIRAFRLNQKLKETVRTPPEILQQNFTSKSKMCLEVMKYSKIHRIISNSVGDLNEIYGFSLVLNFAHDFVLLTSLIFLMFYLSFYVGFEASQRFIINYTIWIMPCALRITLICLACHFTKNEVNVTVF